MQDYLFTWLFSLVDHDLVESRDQLGEEGVIFTGLGANWALVLCSIRWLSRTALFSRTYAMVPCLLRCEIA